MKWTKNFPMTPGTYWWHRGRYDDGSTSKPVVIRVEEDLKWGIVYRCMGDTSSWMPDELEADYEAYGVAPEFAGPLVPPKEEGNG